MLPSDPAEMPPPRPSGASPHTSGSSVLRESILAGLGASSEESPAFVQDLGNLYLSTAPELVKNLRTAFALGNLKLAKRIAHQLRSSSQNLGAERLAIRCGSFEQYRGSPECEEGLALLRAIEADFAEAESALRSRLDRKAAGLCEIVAEEA